MLPKRSRTKVNSLISISVDYTVSHLPEILKTEKDCLKYLPDHIKDRILHQLTSCAYFWKNINLKQVISYLLNSKTKYVDFTSLPIDDEILILIETCSNLQQLNLIRVGTHFITSQGLKRLFSMLHKLTMVRICHCDAIDDDVLNCLLDNNPELMGLDIEGCKNVSDKSILNLASMKYLVWLTLSGTQITDNAVKKLVYGFSGKNLKELRLAKCPNITEDILEIICENCNNLQVLVFYNENSDLFGLNLEVGKLKNLKQLTWTVSW